MRRAVLTLLAVALLLPAQAAQADLKSSLARYMRLAGGSSGAYVYDISAGKPVFAWRAGTPRILASNTKLFTSAAALARFGTDGTLGTEVLGDGELDENGIWRGNLYLRGGGDPTFGSSTYTRKYYGGGATVQQLAKLIDQAGVERITGRVYGDESRFDSLRGGPDSGYGVSIWVGPLSALAYNRGFASESGSAFQLNPPAFAAARLDDALEARGIAIKRKPIAGKTPRGLEVLASVDSPPMERIIRLMNEPSDNFFAEMLAKDVALQVNGRGTTSAGAALIAGFARRLGSGAQLVDGSGLSRGNRASPYRVVRLLRSMYNRDQVMQELLTKVWEQHKLTVLFVTHDIDEAVFLSDRVVVMTARPGRVKLDTRIDLPRPRTFDLLSSPELTAYKASLLTAVREEALAASALTVDQFT